MKTKSVSSNLISSTTAFVLCITGTLLSANAKAAAATTGQLAPIPTTADTWIRSDTPTVSPSSGTGTEIAIGQTNGTSIMRGLLSFDLSGVSLPEGKIFVSAELDIMFSKPDGSGFTDSQLMIGIHELATGFDEATATWNNSAASVAWKTGGGDFDATNVLASRSVPTTTTAYSRLTWADDNLNKFVASALAGGEGGTSTVNLLLARETLCIHVIRTTGCATPIRSRRACC
ncbi:MAG: DNRLRE domain-containing protein [Opitutaceae bacterium]|nr:DNRLRE domain-containing protein [Opitutaceae bacterium]